MSRPTLDEVRAKALKPNYATLPWYGRQTHHLTVRVVRWLAPTRVTPNQVTCAGGALAMLGAALLSLGTDATLLTGCLVLQAAYVLDSVDGQLARWRGQTSWTGYALDVSLNAISLPGMLLGATVGLSRMHPARDEGALPVALPFGCLAALGAVLLQALFDAGHAATAARIRREGKFFRARAGTPAASATDGRSPAHRAFTLLHKICANPQVMNVLTLCALGGFCVTGMDLSKLPGGFLIPPALRGYYHPMAWALFFYGVAFPVVWLAIAVNRAGARRIEREFEETFESREP